MLIRYVTIAIAPGRNGSSSECRGDLWPGIVISERTTDVHSTAVNRNEDWVSRVKGQAEQEKEGQAPRRRVCELAEVNSRSWWQAFALCLLRAPLSMGD